MRLTACLVSLVSIATISTALADDPFRVLEAGKQPQDARLGKPKDYNGYFPWTPPTSKESWDTRRTEVREQLLVATGLWPLPPKTPLNPVIHGKIERDDYTIEKVYFASLPGHYVTGNLYRPKGAKPANGKYPGVLCPHGHWANGRFFEANEKTVEKDLKDGAEKTKEGAMYPLQARCAQLARMGCIVFHYDMVGYADSQQIKHRVGFTDVEAELRLQSFMGLQTWNSVRSLDFLLGLADVDAKRIAVTGASGGGTQTFILGAIDDRPAVAFPAVMVSTAMQGGCICENCSYLRTGTGNVEIAGVFAPKPLGMSAAKDWTVDIETKGLPELKKLYKLVGSEENVIAKCYPQFGHNYNQVSRELMYNWFNKHLNLGQPEHVVEKPFVPVPPKELSVFDEAHPLPKDAVGVETLRRYLTETSDKQIAALVPKDAESLKDYRRVMLPVLQTMMGDRLPRPEEVEDTLKAEKEQQPGIMYRKMLLSRKGANEQVPAIGIRGAEFDGTVVIWIHPAGKSSLWQDGKLAPVAKQILDKKAAILAPDVFMTGEFEGAKAPPIDPAFAGYTFGYNQTLLANRVHDILTAIALAKGHKETKTIHLLGFEKAGPWVLLARPLCGDAVARTAADANLFRFDSVRTMTDEMMQPGALKYGGLWALAALTAPAELYVHNHKGTGFGAWSKAAYKAAGKSENREHTGEKVEAGKVVKWLLR